MTEIESQGPSPATNLWLLVGVILVMLMDAVNNGPLLVAILLLVAALAGAVHKAMDPKSKTDA